jgi:outer membrane protein assembly factor BamA
MDRFWVLIVILVTSSVPAFNQATNSRVSEKPNQILAQEVVISGTTTLDTTQLNEITNDLTSRRMGEDDNEIRLRIRDAFQQRGYFDAEVRSLKVKPLDALARPKPVRIEADVAEGVPFKIGGIMFEGNRAMPAEQLLKSFPMKIGELFSTGKVRSGLENLRTQYAAKGYLDFIPVPRTEKTAEGRLTITFEIIEGAQYRMGSLELVADKQELADQLQLQWKLKKGEPFDPSYTEKFLDENSGVLPADFSPRNDVAMVRDCRDMTVAVYIQMDSKRAFRPRPKDVRCEKEQGSSK